MTGRLEAVARTAWIGAFLVATTLSPLTAQTPPTQSPSTAEAGKPSEPVPEFRIIVHRDNPITALSAKALSRIFLKKTKRWDEDLWPEEVRIVPYDLAEKSQVRKDFTRTVHDKSTGAIKSYWQREIFSGRDVNPDELDSDEDMMERVASDRGAIGYVSGNAKIAGKLKVLEIADE